MMKTLRLFFLVFLFGCQAPVEKQPDNLIDKEKFKQMAIDFHLLEAYVEENYQQSDSVLSIFNTLEQEVFKKHNTTKEIYLKSYNYYLRNADKEMDILYEQIVSEISKLEDRAKKTSKKED